MSRKHKGKPWKRVEEVTRHRIAAQQGREGPVSNAQNASFFTAAVELLLAESL
jgi:hypothetical protein